MVAAPHRSVKNQEIHALAFFSASALLMIFAPNSAPEHLKSELYFSRARNRARNFYVRLSLSESLVR